jgi:hypothetical protein
MVALVGWAVTIGMFLGQRTSSTGAFPGLEELRLKAAASMGSDTFAIATGSVDEEVEGLFTLDFVTGDLQCFVMNTRTGALAGRFAINVNDAQIFGAKRGKKPSYLLATGHFVSSAAAGGGARPAACLCYVVDANSGEVAAFGFPWSRAVTTSGGVQSTPMIPMGKWQARAAEIRK